MRLSSIKLAGFKSFVDPTTVQLPSNLVAVVGPNGSGKSNVIDAVRWVMGESSAKYLRGESMTDVIFNGSTGRKPVGQASIELLFDNTEGKLGGEYGKYSQIAVKRLVTRDGQSNYFLNGSRCRRRDVTDLFLGTGLGPRSYAIIMQDTISRLIEAKPEDLRVYLEETAGISKYKERRRETETRINHTRENLARLTDLRDELAKQLNHLQRQANAAERYKQLKEEQRTVRANLIILRKKQFEAEFEEISQQIRQYEVNVEASVAKLRANDADFERQHEVQVEVSETFNQVQEKYYSLAAEIARIEQSKQFQEERQQQLTIDLAQTEKNYQAARDELTQDERQQETLEQQIELLEPKTKSARELAENSQETLADIELSLQQWQAQWDEFNQNSAKILQQAEVSQMQLQHIEQRQQESKRRLQQLIQEKEQIHFATVEAVLQQLASEIERFNILQTEQQANLQQVETKIQQDKNQLQQLNEQLHQQQSLCQQWQGKQASIEALQQIALGQNDKNIMSWLQQQNLMANPRLAQTLKVAAGWESTIEIALQGYLDAVCVSNIQTITNTIDSIGQANLAFVNETSTAEQTNLRANLVNLASKIQGSHLAKNLLNHIYIAQSREEALSLASNLQAHESVITQDGYWYGNGWFRMHLAKDEKSGVLQRQQELEQIRENVILSQDEISAIQQQINQLQDSLEFLEQEKNQTQQQLRQLQNESSQLQAKQHVKQAELQQLQQRNKQIDEGIAEHQELLAELEEQMLQSRQTWQQALTNSELNSQKREEFLLQRDEHRKQLDAIRQRARDDKERAHQLAMELQSVKTQLNAIGQARSRAQLQLTQQQERIHILQQQLVEIVEPLDKAQAQLNELLSKQLVLETELATARQAVEMVEQRIRSVSKERHNIELEVEQARSILENARMQAQTLQVKQQTLAEQIQEMQVDIEQLMSNFVATMQEGELEQQLEDIERRINRLGPINLAAIEEYASVSERKTYLDAQDADLVDALTTLENAIRKIDRETRDRFKETYDKVNEHFQTLFPKIFGGGSAYLELTGDDLLETGVTVMARPPGKRNSTIHLLSGGEKALTAMALVFSLFQLNPAPFCMLDEVDAPLDDANVGRYCSLVKEMSKSVQFIFISHNKLAIEMAEHLIGVTMREPGVSRLVAVDIKEAVELASA